MTQICGESITWPLILIFETALKEKNFSDIWKIVNVVLFIKKMKKKLVKKLSSY